MDAMKSILTREIERLDTISKEQPLSTSEIVNLDKLASAWNKYYGKELIDPNAGIEQMTIEQAIAMINSKEVEDDRQEEEPEA